MKPAPGKRNQDADSGASLFDAEERPPRVQSSAVSFFVLVAVIAALYLGKAVFVPLALAVLFTFLLWPIVKRLERLRIPRIAAVLLTTLMAFALIGVTGWFVGLQVVDLAEQLPAYKDNIRNKVTAVRTPSNSAFTKASQTLKELQTEIEATTTTQAIVTTGTKRTLVSADDQRPGERDKIPLEPAVVVPRTPKTEPVPVSVVQPPPSPMKIIRNFLGPLLGPLAMTGLVIIFVLFMLIEREALRDRIIYLVGRGQLNNTTEVIDEAGHRISRYLLTQVVLNMMYGIPVTIGLYFIGVPTPLLWGVLCALLRFIPYVGPWSAALFPIALSFAVFETWREPMLTILLFVVLELISNNILEPWLYGTSVGILPVMLIAAAVFWTWLWGPVGLFLSTPLTVCLAVMGRFVPQLRFLHILLSDKPALPLEMRLYQRLLAGDQTEAEKVVAQALKEMPVNELYETTLLKSLHLAEQDWYRGQLSEERHNLIRQFFDKIIAGIHTRCAEIAADSNDAEFEKYMGFAKADSRAQQIRVVCLPAADAGDEVVCLLLKHLLESSGFTVHAAGADELAGEMVEQVQDGAADVVCISAMPPFANSHVHYLCKRLRQKFPDLKIVVGVWGSANAARASDRLMRAGADAVVSTLSEAVESIHQFVTPLLLARDSVTSPTPIVRDVAS